MVAAMGNEAVAVRNRAETVLLDEGQELRRWSAFGLHAPAMHAEQRAKNLRKIPNFRVGEGRLV
jgi:hypothetical protein